MNLGVIATWKIGYWTRMLSEIMDDTENMDTKREQNKNNTARMSGIAEGYDAHVLDVSHILKLSSSNIKFDTIVRCWVKSRILPVST